MATSGPPSTNAPGHAPGTSLRRSVTLAFSYTYITAAIAFVVSIILARFFLTPREFGAFSVCMAAYLFLQSISDLGITRFIVQEKALERHTLRAVLAVLVAGNLAIMAGLLAIRHWAASFFGAPEIATILAMLAASALVVPYSSLGNALLTRASRFPALFIAHVGGAVAGAAVGIGAAYAGEGSVSLAWLTLTQALVRATLIVAFCREVRWLHPGLSGIRAVLAFGSPVTIVTFYSSLLARLPEMVLSRLIDLTAAGLYGRAAGLAEQLRWALYTGGSSAVLPELARRFHAGEQLVRPFLKLTAYVTALVWPAAGFLALLSLPLTRFVFGPNWVDMAPLLAVLSLSYAVFSMIVLYGEVLMLQKRLGLYVSLEVIQGTVGLALFIGGAVLGAYEAALSRIVYAAIFAALYIVVLRDRVGYRYGELAVVYGRGLAVTAVALLPAIVAVLARRAWGDGDAVTLLPAAALSPAFWYLGLWMSRHPMKEEVDSVAAMLRRRLGV